MFSQRHYIYIKVLFLFDDVQTRSFAKNYFNGLPRNLFRICSGLAPKHDALNKTLCVLVFNDLDITICNNCWNCKANKTWRIPIVLHVNYLTVITCVRSFLRLSFLTKQNARVNLQHNDTNCSTHFLLSGSRSGDIPMFFKWNLKKILCVKTQWH